MNLQLFWRVTRNILLLLILFYIALCALFFFMQRHLIYFPDNHDFTACPGFADAEKRVFEGTRFYYKSNADTIAVFYHGNAGSACDRSFLKPLFTPNNLSYLIVEYTGYSNDAQSPSKERLLKDAENIHAFVASLNASKIIVIGESIGTAIAAHHASLGRVEKVLLISPFTTLEDVAHYHYPWFPTKLLLREKYNTYRELEKFEGELLIIHGTHDTIVPFSFSEELFEIVPTSKKELVAIEGGDHNTLYEYQKTMETMQAFLTSP